MAPAETSINIRQATWKDDQTELSRIRRTVFVLEQNVPVEIEIDGLDPQCRHVLAFRESQNVGTARMLPDGHIGRVAVLKDFRRLGIGQALVNALIEIARAEGFVEVFLNSQESAIGFYEKMDFQPEGERFYEAGIPHLLMRRRFRPG